MRSLPDRAVLLALAALYRLTETVVAEPMLPDMQVRALLALLHARSSGDRGPFDEFWQTALAPLVHDDHPGPRRYARATMMRTCWARIVRTLGFEPQSQDLCERIYELNAKQRDAIDPEWRAVRVAAQALLEAKYNREIISTKGRPHSEAGRQLMAERIARGEEPAP